MKVITNPDKEYVAKIREKLKENGNYCPCRVKKDKSTKCPCKEFRDQMERREEGYCHCNLYKIVNE